MSHIRSENTQAEKIVFRELRKRGIYFQKHYKKAKGKPDIALPRKKKAIFIDGDFWHGWRFPLWRHKLSPKWQAKIDATRNRDQRNFRKLRRQGWLVFRIWEHQIEKDAIEVVDRIVGRVSNRARGSSDLGVA